MTPNEKPAMTEFSTDTAARAMVLTWPAKTWVMAPREYWQMEVKMAGPARYHSFLDSLENSLKKSTTPVIGGMSSTLAMNMAGEEVVVAVVRFRFWPWPWSLVLGERSGWLHFSICWSLNAVPAKHWIQNLFAVSYFLLFGKIIYKWICYAWIFKRIIYYGHTQYTNKLIQGMLSDINNWITWPI